MKEVAFEARGTLLAFQTVVQTRPTVHAAHQTFACSRV